MRRLWVLIAHLPPESSYRRATDEHWTEQLELSAAQVELTHTLLIALARLGGSKRKMEQLHVPRPGEPAPRSGQRMSLLDLLGPAGGSARGEAR